MKNKQLARWASIAEIIAAVGVIVSLIFVAFSVNRNTAMIEAAEESKFLDAWREVAQLPFYTDAELASIQLKVHSGYELNPLVAMRWENYLRALFDTWWQLHNSYLDGLISEQAWNDTNGSILTLWELDRMGEFWIERRQYWAGTPFGNHIDAEVEKRQQN
jgi:hypothetical protein